jgi:hypothetical protein
MTFYSKVFQRGFSEAFIEGSTRTMSWHDTTAEVFGMLVNWTYTQKIKNADEEDATADDLINLYILADKCDVPKLMNDIIRALEELSDQVNEFYPDTFIKVYENTTPESKLRQYLINYFTFCRDLELAEPEAYPAQMLADMFLSARQLIPRKRLDSKNGGRLSVQKLKKYLVSEEDDPFL